MDPNVRHSGHTDGAQQHHGCERPLPANALPKHRRLRSWHRQGHAPRAVRRRHAIHLHEPPAKHLRIRWPSTRRHVSHPASVTSAFVCIRASERVRSYGPAGGIRMPSACGPWHTAATGPYGANTLARPSITCLKWLKGGAGRVTQASTRRSKRLVRSARLAACKATRAEMTLPASTARTPLPE